MAAGFFGAALALGWTVVQLFTAAARRPRTIRIFRRCGPLVLAAGLALFGALVRDGAPVWLTIAWGAAMFPAGSGIAMAMPHLGAAAMAVADDPDEATKASAGVLVNLGALVLLDSAHYLLFTFALVCALGTVTAGLSLRIAR